MTIHSWCTGDVGLLDVRECVKPCMQPEQAIRIPKRNQLSISYKNERADMQHHNWGMKYWSTQVAAHCLTCHLILGRPG